MNSLVEFTLADFPGYPEAVAREAQIRSAACLGINEVIGGCEVKPLNAQHVRLLTLVRSPFMGSFTAEQLLTKPDILDDIMRCLWIISPMYQTGSKASAPKKHWWNRTAKPTPRDQFNTAFSGVLTLEAKKLIQELLDYIDEAYIDAQEGARDEKSYFAFEIGIAHELHEHYGYRVDFWNPQCPPDKNPLLVPLKLIFQFRKLRLLMKEGKDAAQNKSDRLIEAGLPKLGERHRAQMEQLRKN